MNTNFAFKKITECILPVQFLDGDAREQGGIFVHAPNCNETAGCTCSFARLNCSEITALAGAVQNGIEESSDERVRIALSSTEKNGGRGGCDRAGRAGGRRAARHGSPRGRSGHPTAGPPRAALLLLARNEQRALHAWAHGTNKGMHEPGLKIRLRGCVSARLRVCTVARLRVCAVARLHGSTAVSARSRGCAAVCLRGCAAACLSGRAAARLHLRGCVSVQSHGCAAACMRGSAAARLRGCVSVRPSRSSARWSPGRQRQSFGCSAT
jgi:hypothetical protein